jgi:hypothetical protein
VRPGSPTAGLAAALFALGGGVFAAARAEATVATATVRVHAEPPTFVAHLRALDFAWESAVEARDGRAVILSVPPGRYELTTDGGLTAARTLSAEPARTTLVAIRAGEPAVVEVTVVDEAAEGTAFGEAWLRDLPSGRDAWSLLETTDPVAVASRMDTGGVWAGEPGRATAHGASLAQSATALGGAAISDPLGRGFALLDPDLDWLSAVRFSTSLLPASESGGGPVLSLTPRRPARAWTGTATFAQAGDAGVPDAEAPPIARLQSWRNGTALASGPIGARAGLLVAASLRDSERVERDAPRRLSADVGSALAHLVLQPGHSQELRVLGMFQQTDRPFASRAAALDPLATEQARAWLLSGAWTGRRRDGAAAEVGLSYAHQSLDSADVSLGHSVERLRDGPVPSLAAPGDDGLSRLAFDARLLAPVGWPGGGGLVQAGLSVMRAGTDLGPIPGVWTIPETLDGVGARVWQQRIGRTRTRGRTTDAAAWAELSTDPSRRFSGAAGLRIEWLSAAPTEGAGAFSWLTASPRLRGRWRLGETTALLLGAAQYRHTLPLSTVAFTDPAAPHYDVYRWDDRDADGVFREAERGPLVALQGPGAGLVEVDGGLRAPLTREVVLGIERRAGVWTARFVGLYRRETGLVETVNVGVSEADYVRTTVPDPSGDIHGPEDDQLLPIFERRPASFGQDRYLLTNVDGDDAWHEGAEITVMRDGERVGLLLGATAHRSDGPLAWRGFRPEENDQGLPGERRDNPNADTFGRGRLFSDRAYTIKLAGRYAAPGDFRFGAVARYQDGQPFARLYLARGLAQGTEAIQAVPNGRHRFEFAFTLDARVEKGFRVGRARVAAVAEAFNLLGNTHEVEEYVVTGEAFRTPTATQPPRVWRFGVRLDLP